MTIISGISQLILLSFGTVLRLLLGALLKRLRIG